MDEFSLSLPLIFNFLPIFNPIFEFNFLPIFGRGFPVLLSLFLSLSRIKGLPLQLPRLIYCIHNTSKGGKNSLGRLAADFVDVFPLLGQ